MYGDQGHGDSGCELGAATQPRVVEPEGIAGEPQEGLPALLPGMGPDEAHEGQESCIQPKEGGLAPCSAVFLASLHRRCLQNGGLEGPQRREAATSGGFCPARTP